MCLVFKGEVKNFWNAPRSRRLQQQLLQRAFSPRRASEHGPLAVVERDAGWTFNAGPEEGF